MIINMHGTKWIAEQNDMENIRCPECNSHNIEAMVLVDKNRYTQINTYIAKCKCESCMCEFSLDAEERNDLYDG